MSFWKIDIEITEKFYQELLIHKSAMLILERQKTNRLIPDIEQYIKNTIDFTIINIEDHTSKITILCKLNAYFPNRNEDEEPF